MPAGDKSVAGATRQHGALVPLHAVAPPEAPHDPRLSDVDEWGRSEHMRELVRRLYDPIYRHWFRAEWEGLEKIPTGGGALLVANHAAAIPSDAPVIMHGIETELGRPVYGMADHMFKSLPVVGTLWSRAGGVAAHPENAYRLMREQRQLALVFPEGSKGPGKTYDERYRLRRFGRGGFVEIAMRAGVPIVPIAVVGAEESMPTLFKVPALARLLGLPYVPITANMLVFGPLLGTIAYFPAKFRLKVLDPVHFDVPPEQERYSKSRIMDAAEDIRVNLQDTLYEMLREAAQRLVLSSVGKRVLITGLGTFWGGRMAQALESDPEIDHIIGLDVDEPKVPLQRTEYVRADQSYSILSRIVEATEVDTIVHTFLVVDSTHMSGRALHETNVIGTMNLLAAAGAPSSSVRHIIVKSSSLIYGSSSQDPAWFRESMARTSPPRTRVERSLLEVESYLRDFAEDNPHVTVTLLRFANVLGTDIVTLISKPLEMGFAPAILGFDPLMQFVEEEDVVRSLKFAFDRRLQGVYNVAGDGRLPWSEVASICGVRLVPFLPPVLTGIAADLLGAVGIMDLPAEVLDLLRYGRGIDNRKLKAAGFRYNMTSAGTVETFARGKRLRSAIGESRPTYTYQRDVESFFRRSPAVVRRPQES